jgi:hypothetical protein
MDKQVPIQDQEAFQQAMRELGKLSQKWEVLAFFRRQRRLAQRKKVSGFQTPLVLLLS